MIKFTTSMGADEGIRNLQALLSALNFWQASTSVALGATVKSHSVTANCMLYAECTTAGTTGTAEPNWPSVGNTITDGTAVWTIKDLRGMGDGYAVVDSPVFKGIPQAPTASKFATGEQVATLDYVLNVLGNQAGVVTYTESATLTNKDYGKLVVCNSSSAISITTPTTVDAHAVIKILNLGSGTVTLTAGSGSFYAGSGVVSSPTLEQYASAEYCTDGTNWYRIGLVSSAGGETLFTASGTFTVPTGVDKVFITGCGGGGGGGGSADTAYINGCGGGGAGVIIRKMITGLTPGQQIAITIGIGGAGGYSYGKSSSAGGAGGITSFGSYASVAGGGGGGSGSGGSGTAGSICSTAGGAGVTNSTSGAGGSAGDGVFFKSTGGSAIAIRAGANGNDGIGYGAGGSGGPCLQGYYGGKGSSGMLLVEY